MMNGITIVVATEIDYGWFYDDEERRRATEPRTHFFLM